MNEELDISDEKELNCNAHILLCVTSTADKVLKDIESSVGVHKLIGDGALSGWNKGNSIWYLGLNAFSKMLSPHNSQESCNVYKEYKKFLDDTVSNNQSPLQERAKAVLSKPFLGFDS